MGSGTSESLWVRPLGSSLWLRQNPSGFIRLHHAHAFPCYYGSTQGLAYQRLNWFCVLRIEMVVHFRNEGSSVAKGDYRHWSGPVGFGSISGPVRVCGVT